jgi:DNA polymerase (family X)
MKKSDLDRVLAAARQQLAAAAAHGTHIGRLAARASTVAPADGDVDGVVTATCLPLADAEAGLRRLLGWMAEAAGVQRLELAGAIRRRCDCVDEIVLLAAAQRPGRAMRHFLAFPQGTDPQRPDLSRASLALECGLRVDLRVVPPRSFGAMLHTLTGSDAHNDAVRRVGLRHGVRVSDYGVFRVHSGKAGARRLGGQAEADVFEALGMPWIPPELREDAGEIEAAECGGLPDLVGPEALHGDLTIRLAAAGDDARADELLIAISDLDWEFVALVAAADSRPLTAGTVRRLDRQARVLRDGGVSVFSALEVGVCGDRLDADADFLEAFDLVIVRPGKLDCDAVLRLLDMPRIDVLSGWPLEPTAAAADSDAVFGAAAARGVAFDVEAGSCSNAPLDAAMLRRARDTGVRFVVGSHAASVTDLGRSRYAVDRARRAWIEARHVINCMDVDAVRAWLARRP